MYIDAPPRRRPGEQHWPDEIVIAHRLAERADRVGRQPVAAAVAEEIERELSLLKEYCCDALFLWEVEGTNFEVLTDIVRRFRAVRRVRKWRKVRQ